MKKAFLITLSLCAVLSFVITIMSVQSYNQYSEIVSDLESLTDTETDYPYQTVSRCTPWVVGLVCSSEGTDPCEHDCHEE